MTSVSNARTRSRDRALVAPTATVEDGARVGLGAQVWDQTVVRAGAQVGEGTILGRNVYVGPGARIGERCKVQNQALVYEPAVLGDGVFIGPAVVLTNDTYPRAVTTDGRRKDAEDWEPVGVTIEEGASVGARAVCVAPVRIGRWASIGAGSVVTRDVPAYALVVGSPARRVGWVGRSGVPLVSDNRDRWICPVTGEVYVEADGRLEEAR